MTERITDRIEIVNTDCYTLLDAWPSDAALVTDPPYGIAYQHSGGGRGVGARRHSGPGCDTWASRLTRSITQRHGNGSSARRRRGCSVCPTTRLTGLRGPSTTRKDRLHERL